MHVSLESMRNDGFMLKRIICMCTCTDFKDILFVKTHIGVAHQWI